MYARAYICAREMRRYAPARIYTRASGGPICVHARIDARARSADGRSGSSRVDQGRAGSIRVELGKSGLGWAGQRRVRAGLGRAGLGKARQGRGTKSMGILDEIYGDSR